MYLCGSKIGNITQGAEAITNGYDISLIRSETFLKTVVVLSFFS
jgi:hypothetical protein